MSDSSPPPDQVQAFRILYESVYPDVLRFVQRRTDFDVSEDVVADTFLVLWRRFAEVPPNHDEARAWIFGIARNLLVNTHRGERRREALGVRLANVTIEHASASHDDLVSSRVDLAHAWHLLSEVHQEALGLALFDDLSAAHAARVLGISPVAFRLRLSRARRALRLLLYHFPSPAPAVPSERTSTR